MKKKKNINMMANVLTVSIAVVFFCLCACEARKVPFLADDDGICKSMVQTQGYPCEEHKVKTKDGYILSMQRIPAKTSGDKPNNAPVLLQHGLFIDAATWLLNSPEESLAFILTDSGFDVWLANTRGTKYSRGHTSLGPRDPAYWDWSWDELAAYELPALFQYVHGHTGQKLHYVGHSLGSLMALAVFSQHKLLNMLKSAALLSPIAYLGQMPAQLAKTAAESFLAEDLYRLGVHEFVPGGEAVAQLVEYICNRTHSNCSNLMAAFTGNSCCVNSSKIDALLEHEPQPTATKNIVHLSQMIRRGTITMYDYGSQEENNKHYGQASPPVYDMASIPNDIPLFLGYGGQDMLSDVKDVQKLLNSLKDHDADKLVLLYREEYAHVDFVLGVNANEVVYDPLMAFFKVH